MADIESALDEVETDAGLKNAIKEIFTSLNNFSSNADSKTHANIVATAFKNLTQVLHQFDSKLENVAQQQKYNLSVAVKDVNAIFEKVASLNSIISKDLGTIGVPANEYYGPNELLDERNLLLDELARYGDLDVTNNPDGTVTLKMNGKTVVEGNKFEKINYQENNNGTVSLNWQSDGKSVKLTKGSLKATVDMLNGRGAGASSSNEGVEKGILYYKDKINTFASTIVNTVNSTIPQLDTNGNIQTDANGNIIYKTLLGARVPKTDATGKIIEGEFEVTANAPVTADNISISTEWANDSSYIIMASGDKSADYITALANALTKDKVTFYSGETFVGTFEEYINDYAQTYGAEAKYSTGRLDASAAIADDLLDRRDQVSAVMPDEETTYLMIYNKSYQAAARLMTTMDEALDVLINKTGLVGR